FHIFKEEQPKKSRSRNLLVLRIIALLFAIGGVILIFLGFSLLLIGNIFTMLGAFVIWICLSSFYLARLIHDISTLTSHRTLHLLLYTVILGGYLFYLIYLVIRSQGQNTGVIQMDYFDWLMSLVLFLFSMGSWGHRVMPGIIKSNEKATSGKKDKKKKKTKDIGFEALPFKTAIKLRAVLIAIMFLMLGFQVMVQGGDLIALVGGNLPVGTFYYNILRLIFLGFFGIGFYFVLLFRRIKKK
ncbi:MAG: hypothetical protein ACTSRA_17215, partial [Promethearchaeota archaeon]